MSENVSKTRVCEKCGYEGESGFWWPSDMDEEGRLHLCKACITVMSCDGPDPDQFLWERWRTRRPRQGSPS